MKHRLEIWASLLALGLWIAGTGALALVAWSEFANRGCAGMPGDQWPATAECPDAVLTMWIGGVACILGVAAFGFALKAVRHA